MNRKSHVEVKIRIPWRSLFTVVFAHFFWTASTSPRKIPKCCVAIRIRYRNASDSVWLARVQVLVLLEGFLRCAG